MALEELHQKEAASYLALFCKDYFVPTQIQGQIFIAMQHFSLDGWMDPVYQSHFKCLVCHVMILWKIFLFCFSIGADRNNNHGGMTFFNGFTQYKVSSCQQPRHIKSLETSSGTILQKATAHLV